MYHKDKYRACQSKWIQAIPIRCEGECKVGKIQANGLTRTLGSRLREARMSLGISQCLAAELTGISNANISNYERDFRRPKTETVERLANVYGVPVTHLIPEEEEIELDPLLARIDLDQVLLGQRPVYYQDKVLSKRQLYHLRMIVELSLTMNEAESE